MINLLEDERPAEEKAWKSKVTIQGDHKEVSHLIFRGQPRLD